jgi:hypothetical protein
MSHNQPCSQSVFACGRDKPIHGSSSWYVRLRQGAAHCSQASGCRSLVPALCPGACRSAPGGGVMFKRSSTCLVLMGCWVESCIQSCGMSVAILSCPLRVWSGSACSTTSLLQLVDVFNAEPGTAVPGWPGCHACNGKAAPRWCVFRMRQCHQVTTSSVVGSVTCVV